MITTEKNIRMLKQKLDHIRNYADEIYDMVDELDEDDQLPLWWLAKIIRANDYISSAKHYLEYELENDEDEDFDIPGEDMMEESLSEKLSASSTAGEWVKDFYKSDAPQFKGKDKAKRREMAIAAFLSRKS